jgi:hypothetical protein
MTITLGVHCMRLSVFCPWTSTKDSFRVTFERTQATSGPQVPQSHGIVSGTGEGAVLIGTPRHTMDSFRMTFEHTQAESL